MISDKDKKNKSSKMLLGRLNKEKPDTIICLSSGPSALGRKHKAEKPVNLQARPAFPKLSKM